MPDSEGNAYGPYDVDVSGSESEPFTERNWARVSRESGVYSGGDLTFAGLTATLAAIDMLSHGFFLDTTARLTPWSYASTPTTGAQPRRDLLVARRQLTAGEGAGATPGKTFLHVIEGTPAGSPANQDHDVDNDEPLWSWQVPAGGGTAVTDVRDHRRYLGDDKGLVAHGYGTSSQSSNSTEARITASSANPTVNLVAGRKYRVEGQGLFDTSADGNVPELRLRCARGSTPSTSSKKVAMVQSHVVATDRPKTWTMLGHFAVAVSGSHTLSLFLRRLGGSGTVTLAPTEVGPYEFTVTDVGPAETFLPLVP